MAFKIDINMINHMNFKCYNFIFLKIDIFITLIIIYSKNYTINIVKFDILKFLVLDFL